MVCGNAKHRRIDIVEGRIGRWGIMKRNAWCVAEKHRLLLQKNLIRNLEKNSRIFALHVVGKRNIAELWLRRLPLSLEEDRRKRSCEIGSWAFALRKVLCAGFCMSQWSLQQSCLTGVLTTIGLRLHSTMKARSRSILKPATMQKHISNSRTERWPYRKWLTILPPMTVGGKRTDSGKQVRSLLWRKINSNPCVSSRNAGIFCILHSAAFPMGAAELFLRFVILTYLQKWIKTFRREIEQGRVGALGDVLSLKIVFNITYMIFWDNSGTIDIKWYVTIYNEIARKVRNLY